ncbi:hypothetical protein O6H91_09G015800 [Diphasiastrum complanatum]|uniref:Uncharacterized protein n=2 Tax=Diphasiastrum complanatum TaxID=34168 RepID=A0ACC2CLQ3_DIPCM|nr:hypothetical protein O6H91_09G015800 [Diphasiastrum complanatum]KAJ7542875.1 hypothetical protein O6H91_09G015800 [Diphasiastrum complanatum]
MPRKHSNMKDDRGLHLRKDGKLMSLKPLGKEARSSNVDAVDRARDRACSTKRNYIGLPEGNIWRDKFSREDGTSSSQFMDERSLCNGDFYVGSWLGNLSDGVGKFLWSDGCMYEGEWGQGRKAGRGKIMWPSGATYEGDFLAGCMHGIGTYVGTDGTTYKGFWSMNLKHGLGWKLYANGDMYEGIWKYGLREGLGRYVWSNGNEYIGDWRGGSMSGKGILTWNTNDRYDGFWVDGLEHGHGIYIWANGASYDGMWSKGLKDGKGVFYQVRRVDQGQDLAAEEEKEACLAEHLALPNPHQSSCGLSSDLEIGSLHKNQRSSRIASFENAVITELLKYRDFAAQRDISFDRCWSLEGSLERFISLDMVHPYVEDDFAPVIKMPVSEREYVQGILIKESLIGPMSSMSSRSARRQQHHRPRDIKRPGEAIIKGHRSYDLMLNLQLGIRYAVGKITPLSKREIIPSDLGPQARIQIRFPRAGSQLTPPHQSCDFKWRDYCPVVFRHLRELFKIDVADYMMSICGNDALRELSSPGKSGSVFYLSHDDKYMIKTMRKREVKVLMDMLPNYYYHVREYENTLVTKFFGLHQVKPHGGRKVRFIVMGNMFCTELHIHRRYDLKGSSHGRSTNKVEIDENTTLKDLDLDFVFHLEPSWREALLRQIECDCKFLESQKIMDYSLLLGVHFRARKFPTNSPVSSLITHDMQFSDVGKNSAAADDGLLEEWTSVNGLVLIAHGSGPETNARGSHVRGSMLKLAGKVWEEVDLLLPGTARLHVQLGVNMPARAERILQISKLDAHPEGELFGEVCDVVLYFGIIDILQRYDISKKIEHACKSLQYDSFSISAVDPALYSKRFQSFMQKSFPAS